MPSFIRSLYDSHAAPMLLHDFADDGILITYEIGQTSTELRGIVRNSRVEMQMDENGDQLKRHRCQIVITTNPESAYGGVVEPQLTARFVINEHRWAIEPVEGRAVEALTGSFAILNLVRTSGVTKSYSGSRID